MQHTFKLQSPAKEVPILVEVVDGDAIVEVGGHESETVRYTDTTEEKRLIRQIIACVDWRDTYEVELTIDNDKIFSFIPARVDEDDTAEFLLWTCVFAADPDA